jgi:hypothetical protein
MTEDKAAPNVLPTYAEARSVRDPPAIRRPIVGLAPGHIAFRLTGGPQSAEVCAPSLDDYITIFN